jgi:S1-C subfamily serine protease
LKQLILVSLLFLSGCSLFKMPDPTKPNGEPKIDVVARALDNTVALTTADGNNIFCSGVAAEGVIFTAAHCVEDNAPFMVAFNGKLYTGLVILVNLDQDYAVIDALGARVRDTVPFSELEPVVGQKVVWTGYPLGTELIMGTGIVGNRSSGDYFMPGAIVVFGQFIPGNSGGPVFDERGLLLGLVSATATFRGGLIPIGYVVPVKHMKQALDAL